MGEAGDSASVLTAVTEAQLASKARSGRVARSGTRSITAGTLSENDVGGVQ